MTADDAMAAGLVSNVVSPDALIQHCLEVSANFTAANKQTIAFAKQAICRGEYTRIRIALLLGADLDSG